MKHTHIKRHKTRSKIVKTSKIQKAVNLFLSNAKSYEQLYVSSERDISLQRSWRLKRYIFVDYFQSKNTGKLGFNVFLHIHARKHMIS